VVPPSPLTAAGFPLTSAGGYAAIAGGGMLDANKKEQMRLHHLLSFQHFYSSL
jgi:hypothetical protein